MFGSESRNIIDPPKLPELALIERIGFGAYGEVWLGYNLATGAKRAVKIVYRASFSDNRPFEREFEGIKKFDTVSRTHPSQLSLFQIGKNDEQGYFYYAMELADSTSANGHYRARTLRADLENGRLAAERAVDIATALAEALAHLHSNGLVHRDVKPSNIIYVNGRPKLADIGLVTDGSGERTILGTEGYLAPDCAGTPKADIYALGKVLYEAVTGLDRREFPKLPHDLRSWSDSKLACELNEIILKACASDSNQRYARAEDLLRDLQIVSKGRSLLKRRFRKRLLVGVACGFLALVAIALLTIGIALLSVDSYAETNALGPESPIEDANMWCERAFKLLQSDDDDQIKTIYADFHRAIALDPNFLRPYVGLLELLLREYYPDLKTEPDELFNTCDKIVRMDPKRASASCARAIVCFYHYKFHFADRFGREAIRRDPAYELGHTWYSYTLCAWGRTAEAREQIRETQKIIRSKAIVYGMLGRCCYTDRDFSKAIQYYQKALELKPRSVGVLEQMGDAYRTQKKFDEAFTVYEQKDIALGEDNETRRAFRRSLREAFKQDGEIGYWREMWKAAEQKPNEEFYWKGIVQLHLGNTNEALKYLSKSYIREGGLNLQAPLVDLVCDDHWDGIRENEQFKAFSKNLGYPKIMNQAKKSWNDLFWDWIYSLRRM